MRWCWLVLVGCGRIGFDPLGDTGGGDGNCDPCLGAPVVPLDTFDRPDGVVGGVWLGDTLSFQITSNTLELVSSGVIVLPGVQPAAGQWAELVLVQAATDQEVALVLQAQGNDSTATRVEASYHEQVLAPGSHVHIGTAPGANYTTFPIQINGGARIRAVDRAGHVQIFVDGVLVHEADAPNFPVPDANGFIGIGSSFAVPNFRVDSFAGGACGCS